MLWWDKLVEDRIRDAQDDGAFDRLPGAGRPLAIDSASDGETWVANHILRQSGFLPDWLQLRKEIHEQRQAVVDVLAEYRRQRSEIDSHNACRIAEVERLELRYVEAVRAINRKIDEHNLRCPSLMLEIPRFPEDLIARSWEVGDHP